MGKRPLVESLERLHEQLKQTETLDDESRPLLEHLQADIRTVLKKPNAASRASLRKRLEAAVTQLEDSHPQLTITIQEVLDHLASV